MKSEFKWDLKAAREEGFEVSIGQPMTSGRILHASNLREAANVLSDLPTLSEYAEVAIAGIHGAPTTFIKTAQIITQPQVIIGYQPTGLPALIGVLKAMEGHVNISGPSGSYKSTTLALILYQLIRMGYAVVLIALKLIDPILLGSMRAAAKSLTRLDKNGNRVAGKCSLVTLQPNIWTNGISGLLHSDGITPQWIDAGSATSAFGMGGAQDEVRRFYAACADDLFRRIPGWGTSPRELDEKVSSLKLDRDTLRDTAGIRYELKQQAAIEVSNLPANHPANISLTDVISQGHAVYIDACSQEVGPVATPFAGLVINDAKASKRSVDPSNSKHLFMGIDECQQVARAHLKLTVEQCRGSKISLLLAYHGLNQFGPEDWESICMARVRIIAGAVPGGSTDQLLLPRLFGTKMTYPMSFGETSGFSIGSTAGQSSGPLGASVSFGSSAGENQQMNFGFTEREVPAWGANETLDLNYDKNRFVLHVSPGAELAHFGPRAIICERGGRHIEFEEVNRLTNEVLTDTKDTILPGAKELTAAKTPEMSPALKEKRGVWLTLFETTAARIRETMT